MRGNVPLPSPKVSGSVVAQGMICFQCLCNWFFLLPVIFGVSFRSGLQPSRGEGGLSSQVASCPPWGLAGSSRMDVFWFDVFVTLRPGK